MPTTLFTPELGRELALKGWEQRRLNAELRQKQGIVDAPPPCQFAAKRLMRVRDQLNRIDRMMMSEEDPQKLDRLASAQAKLAEQERLLDGRPLPGSRRPGREPQRRAPMTIEPVAPAPAPSTAPEPIAPTTEHLRLPGDVTP